MYSFIDIHSHIHGEEFNEDRAELLAELQSLGGATIAVGTDYVESEKAKDCALKYGNVYYCVGIHPVDKRTEIFDKETFVKLIDHPKCVGIGECGLDYFWPSIHNWYSTTTPIPDTSFIDFNESRGRECSRQIALFRRQIEFALEFDKPLMIHGRPSGTTMDAYLDIISILQEYKKEYRDKLRGNIHFFVGNKEIAEEFLKLGFTMSFTGVITFTNDYDEVVRFLPLESIQAETDAPYVAPKPYRGKRNEPKYVREVIRKIAELKSISQEEVEETLLLNAQKVWGIRT